MVPGMSRVSYWLVGGAAALGLIGSLLGHELAHALVAKRAGLPVRRITLWLLGGVSELGDQPADSSVELRVALAGPAVSLGLGILLAAASGAGAAVGAAPLALAALTWLATMNVLVGVFNLLPGSPLDGGRVLHGLLWRHSGDRDRATAVATRAGRVLGALLAGFGVLLLLGGRLDGVWLMLVGWYLAGSAAVEQVAALHRGRIEGIRVADIMSAPATTASGWWTVQAFIDGVVNSRTRHGCFPVADFDGRLLGIVSLADLIRCPAADRPHTPVRRMARTLLDELVVTPETTLEHLGEVHWPPTVELAVVVSDGAIVGVVSRSDVTRAVERAALGGGSSPTGARH
jgi:Zn-dependent protease